MTKQSLFIKQLIKQSLLAVTVTTAGSVALAQPGNWEIQRLGLTGSDYTSSATGYQSSLVRQFNDQGQVAGSSRRILGTADGGHDTWFYDGSQSLQIGLTGSEYTRLSDSYRVSTITLMNNSGTVVGTSARFNGNNGAGTTVWRYNGDTTRMGLTSGKYTRSDGYQTSGTQFLNQQGMAVGFSHRYYGISTVGQGIWADSGAGSVQIGLFDSAHTRSDTGYQYSTAHALNNLGMVIGDSSRFNGTIANGQSAWLYDGNATVQLGLSGADYANSTTGYQFSSVQVLNSQGHAIGYSNRFTNDNPSGQASWIYYNGSTQRIGLTSSEFTSNSGYQLSHADYLNEQGQVVGTSNRYGAAGSIGTGVWIYNGSGTQRIGYYGAGYTRSSNGYQGSHVDGFNNQGQVIGRSSRYNGDTLDGTIAWLYDGGTTVRLGLTDSEHTSAVSGYQASQASALNEQGQVAGTSDRFNAGFTNGTSAWFYDGSTSTEIGLSGQAYTRSDDFSSAWVFDINENGQVVGTNQRYDGMLDAGQSWWLYDADLGQTFDLTVSERSDGYAFSSVHYFGDDGLVLGTYTLFDQNDNDLGQRAFYFTVDDGVSDLTDFLLLSGLDIADDGWEYLASAFRSNALGQIIGNGIINDGTQSQGAYLLTAVPIPAAAWMFGSGLIVLLGFRRR